MKPQETLRHHLGSPPLPMPLSTRASPAGRPGRLVVTAFVWGYGPERRKKALAGSAACDIDQKDKKSLPSVSRPT